jgi:hypothetical protein
MFDALRGGLAAPLSGMGISFSSSLFGLAGSLVLGFLDLQSSGAQNRFYTELEDWLSTTVYDHTAEPILAEGGGSGDMRNAIERPRAAVSGAGGNKAASAAMANLADALSGLVAQMRVGQQTIRDWVDSQAERHREIKDLLQVNAARREVVSSVPSPARSSVEWYFACDPRGAPLLGRAGDVAQLD